MVKFDGYYRVIFDRIPDAPYGDTQFIELENHKGYGVGSESGGGWVKNEKTGFVELHIPQHPAMPMLYKALKQALEDLRIWHEEAFAYTHPTQGHIEYGTCDGCETCNVTMPVLESVIALADREACITQGKYAMTKKEMTPEEAILKLRQLTASFTGIDPRAGQVTRPIQPISEEDTCRALNKLFEGRDKK
jgi:hypothetical protein